MNMNQLKHIISICEKSSLDYFRCSMNSDEIVFSKNNCAFVDEGDCFREKDNFHCAVRNTAVDFKAVMEEKPEGEEI